MIVWLASYPRSGNSFLRTLLWENFGGVKSGSLYRRQNEVRRQTYTRGLSFHADSEARDELEALSEPVFVKTHGLAEAGGHSPALYLVRDGRDAVVSYARLAMADRAPGFESRTLVEATEVLIERDDEEIGGWSRNVRSWTRRDAPTAIVRFEELIADPLDTVRAAVQSLGISLPEASGSPRSFPALHEEDPLVYPRGRVGGWRSDMSDALEELFWRLHGAEMLVMGYRRERSSVAERVAA
jgi:hypothetical protein